MVQRWYRRQTNNTVIAFSLIMLNLLLVLLQFPNGYNNKVASELVRFLMGIGYYPTDLWLHKKT